MSYAVSSNGSTTARPYPAIVRPFTTVAVVLLGWQLAWTFGLISNDGFPSVVQTIDAFWDLLTTPFAKKTLIGHIGDSMLRWSLGVSLAVIVGIGFGACLAWFPRFRLLAQPIFEFVRYLPPLAWAPLALLIAGPSLKAEVFIVFVGAVPPVIINTWTGLTNVDSILFDAGRTLGASSRRMLLTIALPAATLNILTGIRVAMANGWAALIGSELIGAQSGLGFIIINSQTAARPAHILAGMLVIGAIGMLIDFLFRNLTRRVTRWQGTSL